MADSAYLARMKQRKAELEAKLRRLNAMNPVPEESKKFTENGIAMLDDEIKRLSQPPRSNK